MFKFGGGKMKITLRDLITVVGTIMLIVAFVVGFRVHTMISAHIELAEQLTVLVNAQNAQMSGGAPQPVGPAPQPPPEPEPPEPEE
jgi:hypothetical protein